MADAGFEERFDDRNFVSSWDEGFDVLKTVAWTDLGNSDLFR